MPALLQRRSSTSVNVTFLNPEHILAELTDIAKNLVLGNSNIKGIYLFGSLAEKRVVPGSDADLLILLKKDHRRFIDRIPEFLKPFLPSSLPVDVFPYTESEIRHMLSEKNAFLTAVWRQKITLAEQ